MHVSQIRIAIITALGAVLMAAPRAASAGGSNYGITPGAHPDPSGKVREWAVPTPRFARDPAPAPDGSIYIAVMSGNKVARFDPKTQQFREWDLPPGHRPHGVLVDKQGIVWTTGNGNPYGVALDKAGNVWFCRMGDNKLGKLDPRSGKMSEIDMGSGSRPRRIAAAPDGVLWVTLYGNGKLAKVDPGAMKIVKQYDLPGGDAGPYAVTLDGGGMVWANEINTDTVVRLDPRTEQMRVVKLPSSNIGIRKMVTDASGKLWYMGSHNGRLGVVE